MTLLVCMGQCASPSSNADVQSLPSLHFAHSIAAALHGASFGGMILPFASQESGCCATHAISSSNAWKHAGFTVLRTFGFQPCK